MADPRLVPTVQTYKRNWKFSRWSTGIANSQNLKNIYSNSFGYTSAKKKVSGASSTAILSATATATSTQTVTSGITNPDVPRALSVTAGGTAGAFLDSAVVVTGSNVEGKVITESFQLTANGTGTVNGSKAFATVTSVFIPAQAATSGTIAVGTQNKLGVFHRLYPNNTTVKIYSAASIAGTVTLQGVPTVVANELILEANLVTPATTPDGTTFLNICYAFDQWNVPGILTDGAGDDASLYSTSTSTSTSSTSTSTTTMPPTSTSTSSTSSSTSSTSSSTSSTSSSTSSTSTSTTTAP